MYTSISDTWKLYEPVKNDLALSVWNLQFRWVKDESIFEWLFVSYQSNWKWMHLGLRLAFQSTLSDYDCSV